MSHNLWLISKNQNTENFKDMVAEGKDMSCNCLTQIQLYDETQAQINQAGFQRVHLKNLSKFCQDGARE